MEGLLEVEAFEGSPRDFCDRYDALYIYMGALGALLSPTFKNPLFYCPLETYTETIFPPLMSSVHRGRLLSYLRDQPPRLASPGTFLVISHFSQFHLSPFLPSLARVLRLLT